MEALSLAPLIARGAGALGMRLDPSQLAALERHVALLAKWNRSINLTSIVSAPEIVEKHIVDSLAVAPWVPRGTLLDAGSGAGFPGIPIRIARPDVEVLLADSVQKKVAFLKTVLADLHMGGLHARLVRLTGNPAQEGLPRVHAAVSRALAPPSTWLSLAERYVLPGGAVLCLLGAEDAAPPASGDLALDSEHSYVLPDSKARRRIAIYKRA